MTGYDIALTRKSSQAVSIPVIASAERHLCSYAAALTEGGAAAVAAPGLSFHPANASGGEALLADHGVPCAFE